MLQLRTNKWVEQNDAKFNFELRILQILFEALTIVKMKQIKFIIIVQKLDTT